MSHILSQHFDTNFFNKLIGWSSDANVYDLKDTFWEKKYFAKSSRTVLTDASTQYYNKCSFYCDWHGNTVYMDDAFLRSVLPKSDVRDLVVSWHKSNEKQSDLSVEVLKTILSTIQCTQ